MQFDIAVGGATGNVGSEMIRILEQRNFPVRHFTPLASAASVGRSVRFRGTSHSVQNLANFDFASTDILFLSTGGANSMEISPKVAARGCVVIDNSSAFRMDKDAPLIVPEVNLHALDDWTKKRILPVANCSTIQLVVALKPLHDFARIKRIVVATYQSAAGGGLKMLNQLTSQADPLDLNMRSLVESAKSAMNMGAEKPIAFNVVPHIDVFLPDGRTKEEWKMEVETHKILDPDIQVAATCVRVPVFVGHAEAVNIEFEREISVERAKSILAGAPGVTVIDQHANGAYATPLDVAGTDDVFVSRIRRDETIANGLQLWIVADNIRKGAALNAVQIAEALIHRIDFINHTQTGI